MGKDSIDKSGIDKNDVMQRWVSAFWEFSRPHTIIGTTLSVMALYAIAQSTRLFVNPILLPLAFAWLACIGGNIYIVGLNQLEDVEIDKINKPYLPIASGAFSRKTGEWIVIAAGIIAVVTAVLQGPFLLATVGVSLAIGTAYSLPPIRLKRFPFWAALCILGVRGAIVNLGLFLHFNWVLGLSRAKSVFSGWSLNSLSLVIPAQVWVLTVFVIVFTFAIAIFKDIPDMEGDKQYNITTFTIELGKPAVFNLSRWVLTVCYLGATLAGSVALSSNVNLVFLAVAHLVALGLMWFWSAKVNLDEQKEIADFYQFIWKLFFLEYLIFPAACLLG
ncbi:MAG: homogentisate phytyltransferase [Microcoleus sp. PH2017_10_PVI_O_A]|uniref:homogentisate phytyltransferase n=1 Tax=unclassified Microcoleus TaxID=2642155 RepID=UPI001E077C10|nr:MULTISPECIES: homogentisate phytyltransferase [unclassified Microcoleus]TAE77819.1 MAG: homogentisate phytyltransferase [Oscillatoriales cyanobacterium]MCC3407551.1 homogentisate phytyltransferase [Microcoleus sp. PH2017_10_PVI_O_A]MCC3461726.1 homogentisate phytyltransferase [Microcoleus sp. PH2017_11_PCY_U_A]MCC3481497.1 homogentisate phytyltransferase [Microcoleus sp. PH2017_12_PCY_D_A]MCC3529187.1 homogentisate phytyltransferase [Microcoleus sp. PH2017_21_RUC_O_A]